MLVLAYFAIPMREDYHFWIDFSGTCRARHIALAAGRRLASACGEITAGQWLKIDGAAGTVRLIKP